MVAQYQTNGALYETMLEQIEKDSNTILTQTKEIKGLQKNLLEASIKFENEKKSLNKEITEQTLIANAAMLFIKKFIDEFEGRFENNEEVSDEFATDVLAAYEFIEKNHGVDIGRNHVNSVYNRVDKLRTTPPLNF